MVWQKFTDVAEDPAFLILHLIGQSLSLKTKTTLENFYQNTHCHIPEDFDVLLTVNLSIILVISQLNAHILVI